MGKKLAIIPIKEKSKRIPNKNFIILSGVPMFLHTVKEAYFSKIFDKIVISTDVPDKIGSLAELDGFYWKKDEFAIIKRHEDLCRDDTRVAIVCEHVIQSLDDTFDFFCLLLPTNPLRNADDIKMGLTLIETIIPQPDYVMTVSKYPFNANYALHDNFGSLEPIVCKNIDFPKEKFGNTFYADGAVFWTRTKRFMKKLSVSPSTFGKKIFFQIPPERAVDVDEPLDLILVEALLKRQKENKT